MDTTTTNHIRSSDDELTALATEPGTYEFQSELSDSDDYMRDEAPPDHIVTDIELQNATEAVPEPEPEAEPKLQPPAPMSPDSDRSERTSTGRHGDSSLDSVNGALNGLMDKARKARKAKTNTPDVKFVDIQVSVPWISPTQRDDFMYIEPDEEDLSLSRPRRNKVSSF